MCATHRYSARQLRDYPFYIPAHVVEHLIRQVESARERGLLPPHPATPLTPRGSKVLLLCS